MAKCSLDFEVIYGFQIWPKYRVFDSDSEGVLAKKQIFKEGKLCSTKCNGMLNSSRNSS